MIAAPLTVERYRTLITAHIVPGLGGVTLQAQTQGRRDGKGLSPMTLRHVNALLSQVLKSAVMANLIAQSPIARAQTKPKKPKRSKIEVLDESELVVMLDHLKGHWLYMPVLIAAYTGLRRGEVLGLRWRDIDLLKGTLQVSQAVEVIGGKRQITAPKTERSHRTITLPAALVPELARHRKAQSEQRMRLGLGKDQADLVFTNGEGRMIDPTVLSSAFSGAVVAAGVKRITFHGLRHGHITYLLRSGVPVHIVSARAGHARASITLDTYSHLMTGDDAAAAMQADEMLRRALK
jgi:integrase